MATALSPGQFRFYTDALPGLNAGAHRVLLEHKVTLGGESIMGNVIGPANTVTPLTGAVHFEIEAPRFRLTPTDVQAVYPPADASGAFHGTLPFVVLRRRTLPWERGPTNPEPWLVLVVLSDTDIAPEPRVATTANDWLSARQQPTQAVNEPIEVLRVPATLIADVFPYREEVALLTHVRETSLADTALAAGDDDGFFAVVMAGRLPEPGEANTAYLLSIEHQRDALLAKGGLAPAATATYDFPILLSWTFRCTDDGASFGELCNGLASAAFAASPPDSDPLVDADGRLPMRYERRGGNTDVGAYRGPLATTVRDRRPASEGPTKPTVPSVAADGVVDLGRAAAFELGRLLAIADRRILRALRAWRRNQFTVWRLKPLLQLPDKVPPILRDNRFGFLMFALPYEVALLDLPRGLGLPGLSLTPPEVGPFTDPIRTLIDGWKLTADPLRSIFGPDFVLPTNLPTDPGEISHGPNGFGDIVALVEANAFGGLQRDHANTLDVIVHTAEEIALLPERDIVAVAKKGFDRPPPGSGTFHGPGKFP